MRPDAVFECTSAYHGKTNRGEAIQLEPGKLYFKTTGDKFIYLNEFDNPGKQLPWLEPAEFEEISGQYMRMTSHI
ncbi:MAG: hypothetical protein H6908_03895 [Hyphomicrobiales bacterium]|nr:hypothetical protein [Rickettsiales bacterium]MCP5361766.1 hypothetical protein [Hyphomicrobiales bacterium]